MEDSWLTSYDRANGASWDFIGVSLESRSLRDMTNGTVSPLVVAPRLAIHQMLSWALILISIIHVPLLVAVLSSLPSWCIAQDTSVKLKSWEIVTLLSRTWRWWVRGVPPEDSETPTSLNFCSTLHSGSFPNWVGAISLVSCAADSDMLLHGLIICWWFVDIHIYILIQEGNDLFLPKKPCLQYCNSLNKPALWMSASECLTPSYEYILRFSFVHTLNYIARICSCRSNFTSLSSNMCPSKKSASGQWIRRWRTEMRHRSNFQRVMVQARLFGLTQRGENKISCP